MNKKFLIVSMVLIIAVNSGIHAFDNKWITAGGVIFVLSGGYYLFVAKPKRIEKEKQFFAAVKDHNTDLCRDYLEQSLNINTVDERGYSALHYAAQKGYIDIINLFFEKNLNLRSTQPYIICTPQYIRSIYPLLIDIQSNDGSTPLHEAAYHAQNEVVELLIKNKANREMPNNNGDTPLLCAAQRGHISTIKKLIALGANAASCNKAGKSALYFAAKKNCVPLIK